MTELPYIKFWIGDYLRDTALLTMEQSGAYLHLLMAMWSNGGWLRNDPKTLARICRMPRSRWERLVAPALYPLFIKVSLEEGEIIQSVTLSELLKKARKDRAQKQTAANAKWAKNNKVNGAAASAIHSHSHSHRSMGLQERKDR